MKQNKLKIIFECRKTKKNQEAKKYIDSTIHELIYMLKEGAGVSMSSFELIAVGLALVYADAVDMIMIDDSKKNKTKGGSLDA